MKVIMITIYLMELLIGIGCVWSYNRKMKSIPVFNGLSFAFLFYFLLIPILVLFNIDSMIALETRKGIYNSSTFLRFVQNGSIWNFIYGNFMVAICAFFFALSYKYKKVRYNRVKNGYLLTMIKKIGYYTFIIGAPSLILFFSAFGGLKEALSYGEILRNMSNSTVAIIGSKALLKVTARLITVASILFYGLIISGYKGKKYKGLFCTSFLLSILFFLYNAGRAPLIEFVLMFVYERMVNQFKIKRSWLIILGAGVLGLPLLDILDSLFTYLQTGIFNMGRSNMVNYIVQFSTPYKNTLILSAVNSQYGIRFGRDFITGILDLLPGVQFHSPFYDLSEYVRGADWRALGGIPTDFITFAHMEFSFLGVIILSILAGMLAKCLDQRIALIENRKLKVFLGGVLTISFASIVGYTDVSSILMSGVILTIITGIILLSNHRIIFRFERKV